ncbi:HPF/RaiA family ribosome-associated protein [Bermanella sp. R86510]|uniref:HPF/RaiA family ribosome-associated protein n=1 Tax=unclassified Bermanella TaxID=2627862 RepID=UPI0037C5AB7D
MKIRVNARHLALTNEFKNYVKRRLMFALGSRFGQVKRVNVMLSDINGPKGGEDKHCQMLVKIDGQDDVVIEDVHTTLYAAVDRAADRASQTVTKRLDKLRHKAKRMKTRIQDFKQDRRDRYLSEDFDDYTNEMIFHYE